MQVLKSDQLTIQELTLFHGVIRWAESQCAKKEIEKNSENIRKMLGDAIFLICFPLIPFNEFFETVEPMGILSPEEIIEISRCNAMKDNPCFVNNSAFRSEKRSFLNSLLLTVQRAINPNFQQCFVYTPTVQICLERVEVGSFGWDNPHCQYNVKLCIPDGSHEILPLISKSSTMLKNKFDFDLESLVILEPNKRYYICYDVKRKGSDPLCKVEIYHNTLLIKVH